MLIYYPRMRTLARLSACVVISAFVAAGAPEARQRRGITESDLLKFVWVADPQISPDGKQVAFVRVVINEKTDDYETSLWIVPTDGDDPPRALTSGTRDNSPRWAPDGRRLAFVRSAGGPPQIYVLPFGGGEASPVTDLPRGASAPIWSPDGKKIAFGSTTRPDDVVDPEGGAAPGSKPKSDVRVIGSTTYRANGGGWNEQDRPAHLWVTDVTDAGGIAKPRQLTTGKFSETGHVWSRDGSRIYVTSTRIAEPEYVESKNELFAVPSSGGELKKITAINGTIGSVKLSPDGKTFAFVGVLNGEPERSYDQPDLFVAPVDGSSAPRNLTADFDYDINGSIGGDQAAPRGGRSAGPIWSEDGKSILIVAGIRGDANFVRFDVATGQAVPPRRPWPHQTVQSYSASADADKAVAVISTQTSIGDLFSVDGETGASPKAITHFNDDLFRTLRLSEPEPVTWKSFDGREIEGWLMKPPDFNASRKYPFILQIHGGPHSAYGNVFTHEFQLMAARGYVVLFPNPRGSSNYGQEFGNIIQFHYPGDDYKDLMAGVDEVVKRGYIDTTKLGVTGGSGGGLLTNWTITQTTRFAAAVSQRDIADWYGFWFTADFSQFTPSWFRKAPWEDPADYAARSPITHVGNVKTPLMLVLGDDDLRTPPADGGEMMFRALKYMKVPTVMVRFPGETHELSRSGKPRHRIERLQHIVGWFDKWLLGKANLYLEKN